MTGLELIQKERDRQFLVEGWSFKHDDEYLNDELEAAALCYLYKYDSKEAPGYWPWGKIWWKPSPILSRNLIKGGALYLAETQRLERFGTSEDELFNRHKVLEEIGFKIDKAISAES